ncbi:hypothetical protein JYT84_00410 [bacterium AH-315-M10]|nr:hypothetical protein [bacterium AH-315-M10]
MKRAGEMKEAMERKAVGLPVYRDRFMRVRPLMDEFLEALDASEDWREKLGKMLDRAVDELRVKTFADLENWPELRRRVGRLEKAGKFSATTLRRSFQDPLKHFSKWLFQSGITERDFLAAWCGIKSGEKTRPRRAIRPDEMVRALHAADVLHSIHGKKSPYSLRCVWTALLVAAPRISKLIGLDVGDLDVAAARLVFAPGKGKKNIGAGSLDPRTLSELQDYLGGRASGPLFLSPAGSRLERTNTLRDWRAAFSLAVVDLEWPSGARRDIKRMYLVSLSLLRDKIVAYLGGGKAPGPEKRREREEKNRTVQELVQRIRPGWAERMHGIDLHGFRMTAETWCVRRNVSQVFIDRQLGHSSTRGEEALRAFWSMTGQKNYIDPDLLTLDATKVAVAIREALEEAEAEYLALPGSETALRLTQNRAQCAASGSKQKKATS